MTGVGRASGYVLCVFVFLLVCILPASTQAQLLKPAEVVVLANAAAKDWGYDLRKYKKPEVHYQFVRKDDKWAVFYAFKPGPHGEIPIGADFFVTIEDKTKKAVVMPGK